MCLGWQSQLDWSLASLDQARVAPHPQLAIHDWSLACNAWVRELFQLAWGSFRMSRSTLSQINLVEHTHVARAHKHHGACSIRCQEMFLPSRWHQGEYWIGRSASWQQPLSVFISFRRRPSLSHRHITGFHWRRSSPSAPIIPGG